MTQFRKSRPFLPALSLAAALAAGAVQAQAQEMDDPRRIPLCELHQQMPLPASVLDRIRAREDYEFLLRYASENCPETALALTGGATASIGGASGAAGGGDRSVPLCRLEEEWPLSQRALNRIRDREDFEDLLRYASENCAEVALLLADTATATVPEEDETGAGREGPDRESFPTDPQEPTDPQDPTPVQPTPTPGPTPDPTDPQESNDPDEFEDPTIF